MLENARKRAQNSRNLCCLFWGDPTDDSAKKEALVEMSALFTDALRFDMTPAA